jgi:hypothetical protein
LPVFTEVLGYNKSLRELVDNEGENEIVDEYEHGNESEDEEETYGVEGMTL